MMSSTSGSVFIFKAFYNMTDFASGQDKVNPPFWLATRAGGPWFPAVARKKKILFWPRNKSFLSRLGPWYKRKNSTVIMPWKAKKGNWDLSFFGQKKKKFKLQKSLHIVLLQFWQGWTKKGNLTSMIVRQCNWSYGFLTMNRERCIVSTRASVPLQRCGSLWAWEETRKKTSW